MVVFIINLILESFGYRNNYNYYLININCYGIDNRIRFLKYIS